MLLGPLTSWDLGSVMAHERELVLRRRLVGKRFGKLVVVSRYSTARVGFRAGGGTRWKCICDCGKETYVEGSNLTRGHTKSCGCGKGLRTVDGRYAREG